MIEVIKSYYVPAFKMLGTCKATAADRRQLTFVQRLEEGDGVLYFNTLTREMIRVPKEEESAEAVQAYLNRHWFFVPAATDDMKLADQVGSVMHYLVPQPDGVTSYVIFTTTDCNARCFYCFEKGCRRIDMTPETAEAAADFILKNSGDHTVRIQWFGGEPLVCTEAIDRISARLKEAGKKYISTIVSNGYLFNEENVEKAVRDWNLKKVQITLDGTEKVYNRAKAFIYREGSAFRVVMDNIGRLLEAGIRVTVRLNLDNYNAEDLLKLVDELRDAFGGYELFRVYCHPLFEEGYTREHAVERRKEIYVLQRKLRERMIQNGIFLEPGILGRLPVNHCMADSGKSLTILPDGRVGLCEHFTDRETIGNIWDEARDKETIERWKVRREAIPACRTCVLYPECYAIRECPDESECFAELQQDKTEKMQFAMKYEYERWLKAGKPKPKEYDENEAESDEENC